MIIWGTKGRTSKVDSGGFHCPQCGPDKTFDVVQVRNWFTLYFIPIIPLDEAGRYIECKTCSGTFDESARDYDPETANAEFRDFFEPLMLRALVLMARADGSVSNDEVEEIADVMTNLSEGVYEAEDVYEVVETCGDESLTQVLEEAAPQLADEGKGLVLRALMSIAQADGYLDPEERDRMHEAGRALGFRKKAIKQFIEQCEAGD